MQKSMHYLFMEALVRRIHTHDEEAQLFQKELYRLQAGLAGERKLKLALTDYYFKSNHTVLYNFECKNGRGFTHQIDALLITSHFLLIFEVKQISGSLFYKRAVDEFYRIDENGFEENFVNPFDQVYRHQLFIEQILRQNGIKLPVLNLVVIANFRAKLDSAFESMPIRHLSGLPKYLEFLYENYPSTSTVPFEVSELLKRIQQRHPARRKIESNRLKTGVFCNQCETFDPMKFNNGFWICVHCKNKSFDIIIEALNDYRILISPQISNQSFRNFSGIESRFAANRVLSKLNLKKEGIRARRYYVIPENLISKRRGR